MICFFFSSSKATRSPPDFECLFTVKSDIPSCHFARIIYCGQSSFVGHQYNYVHNTFSASSLMYTLLYGVRCTVISFGSLYLVRAVRAVRSKNDQKSMLKRTQIHTKKKNTIEYVRPMQRPATSETKWSQREAKKNANHFRQSIRCIRNVPTIHFDWCICYSADIVSSTMCARNCGHWPNRLASMVKSTRKVTLVLVQDSYIRTWKHKKTKSKHSLTPSLTHIWLSAIIIIIAIPIPKFLRPTQTT